MGIEVKLAFDMLAFISVMVLIVLGLGVIASMMGIFNFAHGEFVLLGAYTVYLFESSGLAAWAGILAAPIVLALVGLVLERTHHPALLRRARSSPCSAPTRSDWSSARSCAACSAATTSRSPSRSAGAFTSVGIDFSIWRTVIIATTIVVIAGSWLLPVAHARSACGSAARSRIPMLARACGISTSRLYALTFAFGSALAGLAGALIVPLYQLSADIGIRFLVQAFLSVMLGGVGTFEGPVLGAAAVGVMAAGLPWLVHSGAGRSAGVRDRARRS